MRKRISTDIDVINILLRKRSVASAEDDNTLRTRVTLLNCDVLDNTFIDLIELCV